MEAALLTAVLVPVIVGALMAPGLSCPGSSRWTGYQIRDHDKPVRPVREDDQSPARHTHRSTGRQRHPDGEPRGPGRDD